VTHEIDSASDGRVGSGRQPQPRIVLTVEEAAQTPKIGRTLMYALVKSGDIESVTIGRLRRSPLDALNEYVAFLRTAGRTLGRAV
jgi:excisionase family DNA binding protein